MVVVGMGLFAGDEEDMGRGGGAAWSGSRASAVAVAGKYNPERYLVCCGIQHEGEANSGRCQTGGMEQDAGEGGVEVHSDICQLYVCAYKCVANCLDGGRVSGSF